MGSVLGSHVPQAEAFSHGFRVLALARNDPTESIDLARAPAARAELAVAMGDSERAQAVRAEPQQVPLSHEDREHYRHELRAADELEGWIR
jgi:hypothetical protein